MKKVLPRFKLTCTAAVATPALPRIRRQLRRAADLLDCKLKLLNVRFVGDREMSRLHGQFMAMPWPTDVLTFPIEEHAGQVIEGAIAVCVPEARRQAQRRGIAIADELLLYALHGLLHLCGYNDLTARDYRRMHAMEDQILIKLGVGPVFNPKAR